MSPRGVGAFATATGGTSSFTKISAALQTTAAAPVNPWGPLRGVVDTATGAFKTCAAMVLTELHPPGYSKYEEAASYWKIIQYPEAIYACNSANMQKVSFRTDIWLAAQQNLAQLVGTGQTTFAQPLPAVGTPEREYVASLFADWYTCVMSWVSIAMYATNIQPAFLLPDSPTSLANPAGLLAPTRTPGDGLPAALDTLRREIKGLDTVQPAALQMPGNAYATRWFDRGYWGPSWMGFTDRAEATGWLDGSFKPVMDPAARALQQGNGGVTEVAPGSVAARPLPKGVTFATVRNNITDPWYQCYYAVLWWDFSALLSQWRQKDTSGVDSIELYYLLGPQSLRRIADTWARFVCDHTMLDIIMASSSWYATNYMKYWDVKGLLSFPVSQAKAAQEELARQKQAVKQAAATRAVDAIGSTGQSIALALAPAVPWGTVAAAGALLVSGLTRLICWRRRKKKLVVPVMQPLMLRSLSSGACNYWPPGTTMSSSLQTFLTQVQAQQAALDAAPAGVVPPLGADDPLATATPPPQTGVAPTVSPNAPSQTTTAVAAGGPAINTSTSAAAPAVGLVPTVQQMSAAAVQASQTPPTSSGVAAAPSSIPWGALGIGGLGLAAAVLIFRR